MKKLQALIRKLFELNIEFKKCKNNPKGYVLYCPTIVANHKEELTLLIEAVHKDWALVPQGDTKYDPKSGKKIESSDADIKSYWCGYTDPANRTRCTSEEQAVDGIVLD
jgi:hypothetical protein